MDVLAVLEDGDVQDVYQLARIDLLDSPVVVDVQLTSNLFGERCYRRHVSS
jgi:hypothetical protein